jgi:hypothetical protein
MRKEVIVPNSLSEITLAQYQKFLKIQDNNDDESFLAIKMIEIFCGIRSDLILKMRATSIRDITNVLSEMFKETPPLVKEFTMNGVDYGFIPNIEEMTFGEYVDLDTYIGDFDNIEKAMGVLYRPIIQRYSDKYLIEEYKGDKSDFMKDMPMDAVLGSIVFFYHLGMDLSRTMLSYLQEEEMNSAQRQILEENGGGINQFTDSLREILEDLKISLS